MFSGLIEACAPIKKVQEENGLIRIWVERPPSFDDLKTGDSISVNGVCLTVETFDPETIQFALGHETLQILKLNAQKLWNHKVNLERSLRFGDRMHGHLVSGHVEALGEVTQKTWQGDCLVLKIDVPRSIRSGFWKKGSAAVHGVSLTVNETYENEIEVCLIPETLKKTNLADLHVGSIVNLETDYLAKALFERFKYAQKETQHGL
jgi:riboflavin synthase